MAVKRSNNWFATLRRDRSAFAVLALVALLIQVLQPLAASAGVTANGMPVVCTAMSADAEPGKAPLDHESCAKCIAGVCRLALADVALLPDGPAWIAAAGLISPLWSPFAERRPHPSPPSLPSGIRAPPAVI